MMVKEHFRPRPIFVLGSARTGTTWLGNMLCGHPEIAGAEHPVHWGQVESNVYSASQLAGSLASDQSLIRFLELYSSTDFFRVVDGHKAALYARRPRTFYDLFFDLMDSFAQRRGARYWSTKLDPMLLYRPKALTTFLDAVENRYGTCRFIGIERDFEGVLGSYLLMEGKSSIHKLPVAKKLLAVVLESGRYVVHYDAIRRLVADREGLMLSFGELRSNAEKTAREICAYLDIPFAPRMVERRYPANSSAARGRPAANPRLIALGVKGVRPAWQRAPALARLLLLARDATRNSSLPFKWRLLRLEHMPDSLEQELVETGQSALRDEIFSRRGLGASSGFGDTQEPTSTP